MLYLYVLVHFPLWFSSVIETFSYVFVIKTVSYVFIIKTFSNVFVIKHSVMFLLLIKNINSCIQWVYDMMLFVAFGNHE